jgi:carbohydrate-selective porin OprB
MKATKALFGVRTITMALAVPHQTHTFMKKLRALFAAITLIVVAVVNPASAENSWSFVMLGDTRGENDTTNGISTNLNIMAQEIASLKPQPKLVIVAGDL